MGVRMLLDLRATKRSPKILCYSNRLTVAIRVHVGIVSSSAGFRVEFWESRHFTQTMSTFSEI